MSYAATTDLQQRVTTKQLVELTDFDNEGVQDDARIQDALDSASSEIDSYCGSRYSLPLTASKQVIDICLKLAIYRLFAGRQRDFPSIITKDHDDAILFLKDVAAEKATLDQPTKTQVSDMAVVAPDHSQSPGQEVFDDNKLTSF
jgi:phage gp36-like protein